MSAEIIKNLKELCIQHEEHLFKLREKLRILDTVPKAKALVGKCFKYKNGFSFGRGYGWVYKHVVGVSGDKVLVDMFEMDGPDKIEIIFNRPEYVQHFSYSSFMPITQKKYMKVYKQVLKQLASRMKK